MQVSFVVSRTPVPLGTCSGLGAGRNLGSQRLPATYFSHKISEILTQGHVKRFIQNVGVCMYCGCWNTCSVETSMNEGVYVEICNSPVSTRELLFTNT